MLAGRSAALVGTATVAFGPAGRGLQCTAVGLTAALHCALVFRGCGMAP